MTAFLILLLSVCVLGVLHTYVLYPAYVMWAGSRVRGEVEEQGPSPASAAVTAAPLSQSVSLPLVTVLMAAHNEEAVLAEKLASLAAQDYAGELRFMVGSDNSTDATNAILTDFAARDARLSPTLFTTRQGKPGIINQLAERAGTEGIFILTDASVMLRPDTISELVHPFLNDPQLGVVDATMVQVGAQREGIGQQEESYIHREVAIKRAEGLLWGAMIGPFGGCYALRAAAFSPVPDNFLVDDFYLCMAAYEAGYRGISSADAVVEEGVGQTIKEEFRRKVRISSGNWQNLIRFRKLWWPFWRNPLAFAFFSHKVLRWWTPFLLLIGFLALMTLVLRAPGASGNYLPAVLLAITVVGTAGLVGLDVLLSALGVHFGPARYLRYFLAMNAALLVGFFRYLTGIKSNVWQPSPRN